jgi:Protein of unknown function (DUF998)
VLARASAAAATIGAVLVTMAVRALPAPLVGGYVSEAGEPGAGHPWLYRVGIALLGVALALLGTAIATRRPPIARRAVPLLLLGAAGSAGLSSQVRCTAGCPLPPYEHTTPTDLVHAGASMGAVGLAALAMLALGYAGGDVPARVRRAARIGAAITVPLTGALGICLLAIGRSATTAVLERATLASVLASLLAVALMLPAPRRATRRRQRRKLSTAWSAVITQLVWRK